MGKWRQILWNRLVGMVDTVVKISLLAKLTYANLIEKEI